MPHLLALDDGVAAVLLRLDEACRSVAHGSNYPTCRPLLLQEGNHVRVRVQVIASTVTTCEDKRLPDSSLVA